MKHSHYVLITIQEKQALMEDVAHVEKLAASIRTRMRRLRGGSPDSIVTSITARMKRLEIPDPEDDDVT